MPIPTWSRSRRSVCVCEVSRLYCESFDLERNDRRRGCVERYIYSAEHTHTSFERETSHDRGKVELS